MTSAIVTAEDAIEPWPFFGYAPGHYMTKCHDCGEVKIDMDKRAMRCLPCAVVAAKRAQISPVQADQPKGDDNGRA